VRQEVGIEIGVALEEPEFRVADRDHVEVSQLLPDDANVVDVHAVQARQIDDERRRVGLQFNAGVVPAYPFVFQRQIATRVAADHFIRGVYYPQSVFGVASASNWRWLEHAAWVLFEDVFLVMSCRRGVREVLQAPRHPYTVGLMRSIPRVGATGRRLAQIDGSMPRLNAIPMGCAFHPRCPQRFDRCDRERPDLIDADDRLAACWLYDHATVE